MKRARDLISTRAGTKGKPAALYRIRFLDGPIAGDLADLEGHEVEESMPKVPAPISRARPGASLVFWVLCGCARA